MRVKSRVFERGHDVPENKIRERYERNQILIKDAIIISDKAFVFDNSSLNRHPKRVIAFTNGHIDKLADKIPEWVTILYKKELANYYR